MNAWTLAIANIEKPSRGGTIKCESERYGNYFDPLVSNKRFCSESCRQQAKTIRRRVIRQSSPRQ